VTSFSAVVHIEAPPDEVVAVLFDVERWPEWTSTMTRVRRLDQGPLAVGSRAEVRQPKLPPALWQVTELDAQRGFEWETRGFGLKLEAGHLVEQDMTGSRVTLSLRFSGLLASLVARFFGSLCRRYIAIEAEGLRKRCERVTC
jgi:uncharacterized membrane protein